MDGKRGREDIVELGRETQFRSGEEAAEAGRRGGIRSGEVRRAKRNARQAAQRLLSMPAKGKMRENLLEMGYDPDDTEGIENIDVVVARLLVQTVAGSLDASERLLKIAGYDPDEIRIERESINADRRKNAESEARLQAMEAGTLGRYSTTVSDGDDGEEVEDVFIYLPDNGRDRELQNIVGIDSEDEDADLDNDGIPEIEVEAPESTDPEA